MAKTAQIDVEIAYLVKFLPPRGRNPRQGMVREIVPVAIQALDDADAPLVAEGPDESGKLRQLRSHDGVDLAPRFSPDAHCLTLVREPARAGQAPGEAVARLGVWSKDGYSAQGMPRSDELPGRVVSSDRDEALRQLKALASTLRFVDGSAWAPSEPVAWKVTIGRYGRRASLSLAPVEPVTGPGFLFALGDLAAAERFALTAPGVHVDPDIAARPGVQPQVLRPDLVAGMAARLAEHAVTEVRHAMPNEYFSGLPVAALEAWVGFRKAATLCEAGVPEAAAPAFAALARMAEAMPDPNTAPSPVGSFIRNELPQHLAYHAEYLAGAIARAEDTPEDPAPRP